MCQGLAKHRAALGRTRSKPNLIELLRSDVCNMKKPDKPCFSCRLILPCFDYLYPTSGMGRGRGGPGEGG